MDALSRIYIQRTIYIALLEGPGDGWPGDHRRVRPGEPGCRGKQRACENVRRKLVECHIAGLKQRTAYYRVMELYIAGHVMRGSAGETLLTVLEGKLRGNISRGRRRQGYIDDLRGDEEDGVGTMERPCGPPSVKEGIEAGKSPQEERKHRWSSYTPVRAESNSLQVRRMSRSYISSTPISTVSMPRRKIRAHYEHMSEFETGRAIGLKEAGRQRSTKGNNRTGGQSNCQNGCRSTGIYVNYHPTCDRHTSVQNDHQQATERAESKSSLTVTMPTPHTRAPTSPTTVVSERSTWNCADWGHIVFSDEFRFLLCPDDRRKRAWRRPGQRVNPGLTGEHHTGPQQGVMVWGAISFDSRTPLVVIPGTLTAQRYVDDILDLFFCRSSHITPGLLLNKIMPGHTRHVLLWIVFNLAELFRGQQGRPISRS
ncbi:hypothetical protein LAZ67_22000131 [Cordylochernes scorpioides]|uniref:Transposase n=1 Tax=Cordylochernes scorpioides TaxID=51811 RepID=A0ABY6LNC0_9ARAC|nr:hypothetical protein LAZ67_22000131 [Cordylochernes scorpioides]